VSCSRFYLLARCHQQILIRQLAGDDHIELLVVAVCIHVVRARLFLEGLSSQQLGRWLGGLRLKFMLRVKCAIFEPCRTLSHLGRLRDEHGRILS